MNLQSIINAAADEADEFLDGITTAAEARPAIAEWVNDNHPELTAADRQKAMQGILALLGREGFFEGRGRGDAWGETGGEGGAANE